MSKLTYQYTSMDSIFTKLIRDYTAEFSETDVIEWAGEALEFIQCVKSFEEEVSFLEVRNHSAEIPKGTHAIIQIAKNNEWNGIHNTCGCMKEVVKECNLDFDFALIDSACDSLTLRPTFDFRMNYSVFGQSSYRRNKWTPVRLNTNTFFHSLVCTEKGDGLYQGCTDKYDIVMRKTLRFSFREGLVAISRLTQATDPETGYPLIPDHVSHKTAIVKYVTLKIMERLWLNGRETKEKVDVLARDWQWYCKQASNVDMMLYGIDEHQNYHDQRAYLLPRESYYGFFGKLSEPENRGYLR